MEVSRILQSAAENLVCYYRLYDDDDWNTVAEGPKRYRYVEAGDEVDPPLETDILKKQTP